MFVLGSPPLRMREEGEDYVILFFEEEVIATTRAGTRGMDLCGIPAAS